MTKSPNNSQRNKYGQRDPYGFVKIEIPRPIGRIFRDIDHVNTERQLPKDGNADYPMEPDCNGGVLFFNHLIPFLNLLSNLSLSYPAH
jgi:hypothetical protein